MCRLQSAALPSDLVNSKRSAEDVAAAVTIAPYEEAAESAPAP